MQMYTWLSVPTPDAFGALSGLLDLEYDPGRVARILREGVSSAVKGVLIERCYVDKDYRSTLYNFYSKMGRPYSPDCVRLHFFSDKVTFDEKNLDLTSGERSPDDEYYGYMVLRPTIAATIGRTVLSPDVRIGASGAVTASQHRVHLLGYRLRVWGFPSMDQHADIAVCAHVACWSILRHYSERYPQHHELLVHDITLMAHGADPGGLVPANGLDVNQAERVFQEAGTYPLVVTKPKKGAETFYWQLLAYLESGFPLFVSMDGKHHAVALIGRSWSDSPSLVTMGVPMQAWDRVSALLVADDHHLPYRCIPAVSEAGSDTSGKEKKYTAEDFERFIVPLPEKIFYPAEAIAKYAETFAKVLRRYMHMPSPEEAVIRYFITTVGADRKLSHF
jgi:hypothetical protein